MKVWELLIVVGAVMLLTAVVIMTVSKPEYIRVVVPAVLGTGIMARLRLRHPNDR